MNAVSDVSNGECGKSITVLYKVIMSFKAVTYEGPSMIRRRL